MIGGSAAGRTGAEDAHPFVRLSALMLVAAAPALLATGTPAVSRLAESCLHVMRFCFATLTRVDGLLHAAPLLLLLIGVGYASYRRIRSAVTLHRTLRLVPRRRPQAGQPLHRLAARVGAADRVWILEGAVPNPAFTAGLVRPRIYLSERLERDLDEDELAAVLRHELHHCRRRDPLRSALAMFAADILFWLPAVRNAVERALARLEFAADDAAARHHGELSLASAILRVSEGARDRGGIQPALAAPELIERRIERLIGTPAADRLPPPPRRALAVSITALALVWFLGIASAASHAAHRPGPAGDCPHDHAYVVFHADRTAG